jgi:L-asparaginase II
MDQARLFPRAPSAERPERSQAGYPENPLLCRVWRGEEIESVHRGAWCLVDAAGTVLAGAGAYESPYYARSSIKALQALPLLESGAAERLCFCDEELALAIASHAGEPIHTERVRELLERLGLSPGHLRCGVHPPGDEATRAALRRRGEQPSALHNNCSGKHAGFLALALELGVPVERYLDPSSAGQERVRAVLSEMAGVERETLVPALDGCSAPTYRLPLSGLARAFARLASPEGLPPARRAACERLTAVAARAPELVSGSTRRLDTDILRASGGRLFPKVGAEAMQVVAVRGGGLALALKIDDGGPRALAPLVLALLEELGLAEAAELERLRPWRERTLRNHAGLETGRLEPLVRGGTPPQRRGGSR